MCIISDDLFLSNTPIYRYHGTKLLKYSLLLFLREIYQIPKLFPISKTTLTSTVIYTGVYTGVLFLITQGSALSRAMMFKLLYYMGVTTLDNVWQVWREMTMGNFIFKFILASQSSQSCYNPVIYNKRDKNIENKVQWFANKLRYCLIKLQKAPPLRHKDKLYLVI